jgi:hypothetical protein
MENIWQDLIKWLDDASKVVGKEAGDLTQKGTLKLELFELRRALRECYAELGSQVYESAFVKRQEDWLNKKQITSIVRRIRTNEKKIKQKTEEYSKIGKEKVSTQ